MTDTAVTKTTSGSASSAETVTALEEARIAFRSELLAAGLLIDAGEPGLYGRNGVFDDVVAGLEHALAVMAAPLDAERVRFAPVFNRVDYEKTDYIASFPHLTGAINTFTGSDRDHSKLLRARASGEPWDDWLHPGETMLVSAVCHPLYSQLTGTLDTDHRIFDIVGYCFRHEPSFDPMRLQAFRMHEFVYVGSKEGAHAFRNDWAAVQLELLQGLGLDTTAVPANDPFFGRAGAMLAKSQLADEAKIEFVVPIYGDLADGTAVASGNAAGDHFGVSFDIKTPDGQTAHSACIAFGMERTAIALFRTHGLDPRAWPEEVRSRLGLGA